MRIYKKIALLLALAVSVVALEKPIVAFAKLLGSHATMLQGNWGSSGVMESPIVVPPPQDNPKYLCQWQIYDNQIFLNGENKKYQKVNWTSFTFDKDLTFFNSKRLKWTVAHVYSDESFSLDREDLIISRTDETSGVSNLPAQFVYFSFKYDLDPDGTKYKIKTDILLKQNIDNLVIGGSNSQTFSREELFILNSAGVDASRNSEAADEPDVLPLSSQLHCQKLN